MDFARYISYTLKDYLNDDDFLNYVLHPTQKEISFWKALIEATPKQKPIFEHAKQLILVYQKQNTFFNEKSEDIVFQRITATLNQPKRLKVQSTFKYFIRVAAVLAVLLSAGLLYWYLNSEVKYITAYGQRKQIQLPDGSEIVLNGNSSIHYARNFNSGDREIWLKGEGYFNVEHLNINPKDIRPGEKFIVHCDGLNISVLGTSFNVRSRHKQTNVGLITGKIKIDYTNVDKKNATSLILKPGDYIQYTQNKPALHKRLSDPTKLTKWTKGRLLFSNATLEDITTVLKDDYGYEVIFQSAAFKNMKIEGEIDVNTIHELLQIISTTLKLQITENNKQINITNINPNYEQK